MSWVRVRPGTLLRDIVERRCLFFYFIYHTTILSGVRTTFIGIFIHRTRGRKVVIALSIGDLFVAMRWPDWIRPSLTNGWDESETPRSASTVSPKAVLAGFFIEGIAKTIRGGSHPFRYSFGLMPLRREKNLLNEGVSAKWRCSAIWVMLSWEVCKRKEASISSI